MLKTLAFGIAFGLGIIATGAALAQKPLKPVPADTPRLLLVDDDEHKHKNKHQKHFNKHRDEDDDEDDDNRSRRSSSRTSSRSQGYYGSSPYYGAPRGYGYYDQPYYDYYGRPYYPYGR